MAGRAYEKGETQSFYNAFFDVFGVRRRSVACYEAPVAKLDNRSGFIDLFWQGWLIVEQKSAGRDLKAAYEQAGEYFDALPERDRPRYILVSDFQTFELHDLDEREVVEFALADLPAHVESFGFILGVQRRTFRDQNPANIEAAELVGTAARRARGCGTWGARSRTLPRAGRILHVRRRHRHVRVARHLPRLHRDTHGRGRDRSRVVARPTVQDARLAGGPARDDARRGLARFTCVNGDLFKGHLRPSRLMQRCAGRCWMPAASTGRNSPPRSSARSSSQSWTPWHARAQGAHYTTEKNILKVIEPLFMDDLRTEFERARARRRAEVWLRR